VNYTEVFTKAFNDELFRSAIDRIYKDAIAAEDALTRDQFIQAIEQLVKAGDFARLVLSEPRAGNPAQTVIYLPYQGMNVLEERIKVLQGKLNAIEKILRGDKPDED